MPPYRKIGSCGQPCTPRLAKNRITHLIGRQCLDEPIRLLLLAVHQEAEADGEAANDLLVLRLVRVHEHLVDGLLGRGPEHDQAHGVARGLAGDCAVVVQDGAQLVVDICEDEAR
jgi:hypothetical protein